MYTGIYIVLEHFKCFCQYREREGDGQVGRPANTQTDKMKYKKVGILMISGIQGLTFRAKADIYWQYTNFYIF